VLDWSKLPGVPPGLSVVGHNGEDTIMDAIEAAAAKTAFVIVDLEGTASLMVGHAIAVADLCIIPLQGSQLDAKQAARQMKLIRDQERALRRPIRFAMLFNRTSPTLRPKTLRHIEDTFAEAGVPVLATRLYDREAYRAIFSFGGTLSGLTGVSNLPAAIANAEAFAAEVVARLRAKASEAA
jgi:chromosome partitioning protein